MADEVEEICPDVEILTSIETAVPCPVEGCSKILFNTASLRMHVVKTHNITENEEEKALFTRNSEKRKQCTKKHFYCPVLDCTRSKASKKPFPRLGQLKQHYLTVHAEKQHTCKKCHRGFGLLAACKRHESKCGQLFHCGCGCPFTTREALLMHVRRKQHSMEAKEQVREMEMTTVQNNRQTTTIPAQVVNLGTISTTTTVKQGKEKTPLPSPRYCKILPKPVNVPNQESTSCLRRHCVASVNSRDAETQTLKHKNLKNSSTQTMFDVATCVNTEIMSNTGSGLSNASVGTQANNLLNSVSMIDFSSQVMVPDIDENVSGNISQSSSIGIQHDHLFMPNHSSLDIQEDPACLSLSSQTLLTGSSLQITDPRFLSTSETQTQDFSQVALEDNASQTAISIFDFYPSISTDCGTQTQTQKIFDELWGQSDVELTESQTQTWLSSLVSGTESDITNQNHILNNRTALDDLVNIHTQTSSMTDSMTFDAGLTNTETQTIPEAFAANSWAFEPINRQTQMTQTATEDIYNQLMDTYTQTLLDDLDNVSVFSSVQTQT